MSKVATYSNGDRAWIDSNCRYHRRTGPAFISADGTQEWWINGKRHREDGPAYISSGGIQIWFVNGNRCKSNKEFQQATKLADEEMTAIILKYGNVE